MTAAEPDAAAPARNPRGERPARFGPRRREVRAFLELFALAGIAFAQPAYDLIAKNTGILVTREANGVDLVALTLLILLGPPLVFYAVEVGSGLVLPRVRRFVHAVAAGVLFGVFAEELLKRSTDLRPQRLVHFGVLLGMAGAALVLWVDWVRLWLRFLAIAPAVFAGLFLFASPATTVVFGGDVSGGDAAELGNPTRVVMVSFDELPLESLLDDGKIDAALYPNFARLAEQSTWYRNTTTVTPYTESAVPAILTGKYPEDPDALPVVADHPDNLFTLLDGAMPFNVHEAITSLCPKGACAATATDATGLRRLKLLVEDSWDLWRDFAAPEEATVNIADINLLRFGLPQARRFTQSLQEGDEPRLDFAHIELPHQPWHLLPTLQDNTHVVPNQGASKLVWQDDVWPALNGRQQHLLQAQATDTALGRIMRRLERVGAWDDSLVVVTADHGVAFTPTEGIRSITATNYDQIMWVPLFVKAPGEQGGAVDDRPVETVDILPTIADYLDVKIPWDVDGRSLLGKPRTSTDRPMYQWGGNSFEPPDALKPPEGEDHLTFDGEEGFRAVLAKGSTTDRGDPALRVYRVGPYAGLVGRPVAGLVGPASRRPSLVNIEGVVKFDDVDPAAKFLPTAYVEGYLNDLDEDTWLAIAVDGTIAGVGEGLRLEGTGNGFWTAVLAPQLLKDGRNDVVVYAVRGTPEAPVLEPIELFRGDGT